MNILHENKSVDDNQKSELLPVVALGAVAIHVARVLNEKFGRLELYGISDIDVGDGAEDVPELALPAGRPIRFLMYDRAEVGIEMAQAFIAKAKAGGKLFTFEIAAHGEKMQPSWRLGTNVLVRVEDEEQCLAAAEAILYMIAPQIPVSIDTDDIFTLFDGMDVVRVGIGTAEGSQAFTAAIDDVLTQLGWKPEFLRGIFLSISGGENLGMKELDVATSYVAERASQDCNIVFGAEVDPLLGNHVRVTTLATCGKRKNSRDASEWMMGMLEEKLEDGKNR